MTTNTGKAPAAPKGKAAGISGAVALILAAIFAVEGGYVNDVRDPGGETNHGITKRVAEANGYTGPMRDLTKERAAEIYKREYIEKPGYFPIVEREPAVAEELIDTGVNAGTARASRWFQEALNHLNNQGKDYPEIAEDGRIGQGTIVAYDAFRRKRGVQGCRVLLKILDAKQAAHYMRLFGHNSKFEAFAFGWFATRVGNVDLAKCGELGNAASGELGASA